MPPPSPNRFEIDKERLVGCSIIWDDGLQDFDRYAFYKERIARGVERRDRGEPADHPIKIVVLAGGYGQDFVADIAGAVQNSTEPASKIERYLMLLRRTAGKQYVAPGLITVNGRTILDYLTFLLDKVDRVRRIEDNMYIVCNDCDLDRYTGLGGWIEDLQGAFWHSLSLFLLGGAAAAPLLLPFFTLHPRRAAPAPRLTLSLPSPCPRRRRRRRRSLHPPPQRTRRSRRAT